MCAILFIQYLFCGQVFCFLYYSRLCLTVLIGLFTALTILATAVSTESTEEETAAKREGSGLIINITNSASLNDTIKPKIPVLVDFYADWCAPCKMLAPTIEELATEYIRKVIVAKVDIGKSSELAVKYGIQRIPCVIIFNDDKEVKRIVGLSSKNAYKSVLDPLITQSNNI
jgi:thioredoxin 1